MPCLIHSPAFNNVKMAWVAGVGGAADRQRVLRRQRVVRRARHAARAGQAPRRARAPERRRGARAAGSEAGVVPRRRVYVVISIGMWLPAARRRRRGKPVLA